MPFFSTLSVVAGLLFTYYLLFIYLSRKNIIWGVYLICALLPTYLIRFSVLGIPMTLLEGMIVILFVVWLIKEKVNWNPLLWIKNIFKIINLKFNRNLKLEIKNSIPNALHLPIILLLIASTISVFIAPDLRAASGIWKAYFIEPLMFLLIFVYNIKTTDQIKNVIRCLGLTALVIGIFAVIQKFTGALIANPFWANEATRRITTFFGYPNANALFLVPVFFLTLGNLAINLKLKVQHKTCNIYHVTIDTLIIILSILTIVWTRSAGALIALIIGLAALLIFYKKTRLITLLIILIASVYAAFSPLVQQKIQKTYVAVNEIHLPQNPSDFQIRWQMWRETLAMMTDTPIFGAGLAGYQTLVAPYHVNKHLEIFLYPHNFFLNFWTETGLLGLISIIWILSIFFILSYKSIKYSNILILKYSNTILTLSAISAIIALLVYGLVDAPYFKNDLAVEFWIIIGIMIVIYNNPQMMLEDPPIGR